MMHGDYANPVATVNLYLNELKHVLESFKMNRQIYNWADLGIHGDSKDISDGYVIAKIGIQLNPLHADEWFILVKFQPERPILLQEITKLEKLFSIPKPKGHCQRCGKPCTPSQLFCSQTCALNTQYPRPMGKPHE